MQVFRWPEGPRAPGASDSGSVVAPQSQGDEQEPATVLLGDARRTSYTVPLQTRAAHVLCKYLSLLSVRARAVSCHDTKPRGTFMQKRHPVPQVYHPLV